MEKGKGDYHGILGYVLRYYKLYTRDTAPNNGESNGKSNGSWDYIGGFTGIRVSKKKRVPVWVSP